MLSQLSTHSKLVSSCIIHHLCDSNIFLWLRRKSKSKISPSTRLFRIEGLWQHYPLIYTLQYIHMTTGIKICSLQFQVTEDKYSTSPSFLFVLCVQTFPFTVWWSEKLLQTIDQYKFFVNPRYLILPLVIDFVCSHPPSCLTSEQWDCWARCVNNHFRIY